MKDLSSLTQNRIRDLAVEEESLKHGQPGNSST